MKLIVVALVALAVAAAAHPLQSEFRSWMTTHGKSYASEEELAARMAVYADNKVYIAGLNALYPETQFGLNKFADLTQAEFRSTYLSTYPRVPTNWPVMDKSSFKTSLADLPASFDWREHKPAVVNPVKNQGQCGSCWAFSTVSALESAWALAGNPLVSLSEQQVVDCCHNCVQYHGQKSCAEGCNGGLQAEGYDYLMQVGGSETETDYPYIAADGQCKFNKADVAVTLTNYTFVSTYEAPNEEALLMALYEHGPIAIAADAATWQFYIGGVVHADMCGKSLDHGIVIVGYGTHRDLLGKETPMWIVRNSWGSTWGSGGYLFLQRGVGPGTANKGVNTCGCADYALLPLIH